LSIIFYDTIPTNLIRQSNKIVDGHLLVLTTGKTKKFISNKIVNFRKHNPPEIHVYYHSILIYISSLLLRE
jgi:hypothetical protein